MKNTTLTVEALQNAAAITAEVETLSTEVKNLLANRAEVEAKLKSTQALLSSKQAEVGKILGNLNHRGRKSGFKVSAETRAKMVASHKARREAKTLVNAPVDATAGVTVTHSETIVPVEQGLVGTAE